jgi:N-acetylneuraminate synthase/N,N'-diacetyllegionaminate synthase
VKRFHLDEAAHRRLFAEAAERNVTVFSSAITEDWVPFLAAHCPAIKIASGDLNFELVIRAAARSGKPVVLSTGCGMVEDVDRAVDWVRQEIGSVPLAERLVLLHCVSGYPTPIEQANLLSIPFLRERYRVHVGFSNHIRGPNAVFGAAALGACLIEVHVTDKREGKTFRDHELSFEPQELAELINSVRAIRSSLGHFGKAIQPVEQPIQGVIHKGVVAARDLAAGSVLREQDIMFARPGTEFPASEWRSLIGRRLIDEVQRGELIRRKSIIDAQ